MTLRGAARRERRASAVSGPNIPEAQRYSVRIRLSHLAHALATEMAGGARSPAEVIEELLVAAAAKRKQR